VNLLGDGMLKCFWGPCLLQLFVLPHRQIAFKEVVSKTEPEDQAFPIKPWTINKLGERLQAAEKLAAEIALARRKKSMRWNLPRGNPCWLGNPRKGDN
jgi:hypothetical protein